MSVTNRTIHGGLLDYDEHDEDDDRRSLLTQHTNDPLAENFAPSAGRVSAAGRAADPLAPTDANPSPQVPGSVKGSHIPSDVPAPDSLLPDTNKVSLVGTVMRALADSHLPGRYLKSKDRQAYQQAHKIVDDPLTRCPILDATVQNYAKQLNVRLDTKFDETLKDLFRRYNDIWHPLLAIHELAECSLDTDSALNPTSVQNLVSFSARYLAAANQKLNVYRRASVLEALDLAVSRARTNRSAPSFSFRHPILKNGSLGADV
ncbi:MAG: hypothetical protein GY832_45340 [Chloroflexi bacterium]|nr:hypothetical protein [Chloroflexota bacterium]